jgi:hypothetical protein
VHDELVGLPMAGNLNSSSLELEKCVTSVFMISYVNEPSTKFLFTNTSARQGLENERDL